MKIFNDSMPFRQEINPGKWEYWKNALFLDIETTGLSPFRSHLYLIGAAWAEDGHWRFRQWFLDRPGKEGELLNAFRCFAGSFDRLVHFNGQTFDLPYLEKKYAKEELPSPITGKDSLDLLRRIRPFGKALGLSSLRQQVLEETFYPERTDHCSGEELIGVYRDYLGSGEQKLLDTLLLHNLDDLKGMIRLLPLLSYGEILREDWQFSVIRLEEEPEKGSCFLRPRRSPEGQLSEDRLLRKPGQAAGVSDPCLFMEGQLSCAVPREICLDTPFGQLTMKDRTVRLLIPSHFGEHKLFYPDYRNYYYLPGEDMAIHRSVADFVDRSCREKAKADTCYQRQEGFFFPQPEEILTPAYRDTRKTKECCFHIRSADPDTEEGRQALRALGRCVLHRCFPGS